MFGANSKLALSSPVPVECQHLLARMAQLKHFCGFPGLAVVLTLFLLMGRKVE